MNWKCRIDCTIHKQLGVLKRKSSKIVSISKKALDPPYSKINVLSIHRFSVWIAFCYVKMSVEQK